VLDTKVILETALNRDEISPIEALVLLEQEPEILPELFEAADEMNRRLNNNIVTFVRSKKVHYTNVCRAECKFCSFFRRKNDRKAFTLEPDEVVEKLRPLGGAQQVEIQGGLNPDLSLDYHLTLLRRLRDAFPRTAIHGYSPAEIWFIARRVRSTPYDVLRRMKEAGLNSMPGDAAVILNDKIRKKIAFNLLRTYEWIDILKTAHRLAIPTTATILFGHLEDEIQVGEHLETIKHIQRQTGGIQGVCPVPYLPEGSALSRNPRIDGPPDVQQIFRIIAVTRLFFGRLVKNVIVDWTKIGFPQAVKSLEVGANDFGTLAVDRYEVRAPEVNGPLAVDVSRLKTAVRKAGRIPIERRPFSLPHAAPAKKSARPAWQLAEEPALI
jgi:CofH subfamily radical SAM domain protein